MSARLTKTRRVLLGVFLLVAACATSASAAPVLRPSVSSGWPVIAPSGANAYVAGDGRVLASTPIDRGPAEDAGYSEGFSSRGTRLWLAPSQVNCGNCDGPSVPLLSAAGILSPIGWIGDGPYALDLNGKSVRACNGAIADDASCYELELNPIPGHEGGPAYISRVGVWSFSDAMMPGLFDDTIDQPAVAFDSTTVYMAIEGQLVALDRASGRLLWRQMFSGYQTGLQRAADGTIVLGVRDVGTPRPDQTVVVDFAPTGEERWRAAVPGRAVAFAVDPRGPTAYVGLANAVVAVSAGTVRTIRGVGALSSLAVAPNGQVVVGAVTDIVAGKWLGIVSGLDGQGRLQWRFEQPLEDSFERVATPAFARDGSVLVTIGRLLFRLDPRRAAAPAPAAAQLVVRSGRIRSGGPEQVCPTGRPDSCDQPIPASTVIELRLPRGTPRVRVSVLLQRTDGSGTASRQEILGRAGSRWIALRNGSTFCSDCGGLPAPAPPGQYVVRAVWSFHGHTLTARAPLTIVS